MFMTALCTPLQIKCYRTFSSKSLTPPPQQKNVILLFFGHLTHQLIQHKQANHFKQVLTGLMNMSVLAELH